MHQRGVRPRHLALARVPAQLSDGFRQREHGSGITGVAVGEQPPVGVHGQPAAKAGVALGHERAGFPFPAEAEILQLLGPLAG
jgi:hypothetical protein